MERVRNGLILLALSVLLIFLVIIWYMKYLPKEQMNESNNDYVQQAQIPSTNPSSNQVEENEEEEKPSIDQSVYEQLYDKFSIINANTECLDYYLKDKITMDTISDELVSYLLIKNTLFETMEVKEEEIKTTLLSLFGKELVKETYAGTVEDYNYLLTYNAQFATYSIVLNRAQTKNYKLQTSIINRGNEANELFIIESYTLDLDGEVREGQIKYTFKKDENSNNYFFESVEKV